MKKLSKRFSIAIAGLVIEIDTVSLSTALLCYDFICEGNPDLCVSVTDRDVEREISLGERNHEHLNIGLYETLAVYRKIVEAVIPLDIFLIHGAAISIENRAVLFAAPSGTGKTTHIKHWLQSAKGAFVINGDKPLIKMTDSQAIVCGTPWAGSEQYCTNTQAPLAAIVFMERNETNEIEEITFKDAYPLLLQQTYLPNDINKAKMVLKLINGLNGRANFYKFRFNNFAEDCFQISFNAIMEKLHEKQ